MSTTLDRRTLLLAGASAPLALAACAPAPRAPFRISLAQWSLNRRFFGEGRRPLAAGDITYDEWVRMLREAPDTSVMGVDPLDFPVIARNELEIEGVEYVNQFFLGRGGDDAWLAELKRRADGEGVTSVLIMCDHEGALGDPDPAARAAAVEAHHKWADAAALLGCHSIRVNAQSAGSWDEQVRLAADGLSRLADYADGLGLNVIVENHGGLSSNGRWLSEVMRAADHPRVGTLPDFGNFRISADETYDPYVGVEELMPFAKGVSAKCYDFDADGNETTLDFPRLMSTVLAAGYHDWVGVEYEGQRMSEPEGILAGKALLERIAAAHAQ